MKRLAPNFGQKLNQTLLDLKSAQESIGMVYLSSKCSPSPIGFAAKVGTLYGITLYVSSVNVSLSFLNAVLYVY